MNFHFTTERDQVLSQLENYQTSQSKQDRDQYLLSLFHFQYKNNAIYREYCQNLKINAAQIVSVEQIPYLPISAFKYHEVKSGHFEAEEMFTSSGTTNTVRSKHFVKSVDFYTSNTTKIWSQYFKLVQEYCFFALLPGYLERDGSSLISMVNHFIDLSKYKQSGFFLRNHESLADHLQKAQAQNIPVVLFGVTYALLDFAADFPMQFPELIVMETGGMKGQRAEITKQALHDMLKRQLGTENIFSEYGMTELLSQAYTSGTTRFKPNMMLQVHTRQINDPLSREKQGKSGIIAVTDLANIDSCAFILTEDQGICYQDDSFEITGRLTAADIRGCNLLLEEIGK